ncbi:class I SAM-dependent methyltransferase, partial [bacterium]
RPEKGIAYTEKWVRELFKKTGFVIEAIHYGSWCGRKEYLNGQDIIVARKP